MKKWKARRLCRKSRRDSILSIIAENAVKLFKGELRSRSFYRYILPSIQNALKVHKAMRHNWKARRK